MAVGADNRRNTSVVMLFIAGVLVACVGQIGRWVFGEPSPIRLQEYNTPYLVPEEEAEFKRMLAQEGGNANAAIAGWQSKQRRAEEQLSFRPDYWIEFRNAGLIMLGVGCIFCLPLLGVDENSASKEVANSAIILGAYGGICLGVLYILVALTQFASPPTQPTLKYYDSIEYSKSVNPDGSPRIPRPKHWKDETHYSRIGSKYTMRGNEESRMAFDEEMDFRDRIRSNQFWNSCGTPIVFAASAVAVCAVIYSVLKSRQPPSP
jgi:hypothetical protein